MAVPTADSTPRTDSESAGLRWTSAGVRQIEVRGEHRRTSRGEHRRTVRQVMSAADTSGHKPADKLADTNRRTEQSPPRTTLCPPVSAADSDLADVTLTCPCRTVRRTESESAADNFVWTVYSIPLSSHDSRSQHADDNYPFSENTMMTSVHVTVTLSELYHLQTAYSANSLARF